MEPHLLAGTAVARPVGAEVSDGTAQFPRRITEYVHGAGWPRTGLSTLAREFKWGEGTTGGMRQRFRSFVGDERAIEGLPIRLVIALVVGVASLSVMMNMLSGVQGLAVVELDTKPVPEVVAPGSQEIDVQVVAPDGTPVTGATVVARGGTARLDGVTTARTNENGTATLRLAPALGPNQVDGTVEFTVKPPAGSQYVDRRANTAVLVVRR